MITRELLRKQLRGSIEIIIGTAAVIIGVIAGVNLVADTIGDVILDIIRKYYGPRGLFNLGLPDIFWIILGLFIFSFTIKLVVSLAMPVILPFYGYCPRCGVKPLPSEDSCSECGCNLYRKSFCFYKGILVPMSNCDKECHPDRNCPFGG